MKKIIIIIYIFAIVLVSISCNGEPFEEATSKPEISIPIINPTEAPGGIAAMYFYPVSYKEDSLNEDLYNSWSKLIKEEYDIEIIVTDIQSPLFYDAGRSIQDDINASLIFGFIYVPSKAYNILYNLKSTGKILPLNEYLKDNTNWQMLPKGMKDMCTIDDEVWALPNQYNPFYYLRSYKKDWLKSIDMEAPTSLDELYQILGRFTTDDPDGDGINNTKGTYLSVSNVIDIFCENGLYVQPNSGIYSFSTISYNPEKSKFEDSMYSENAYEALSFIKSLYDNKYADVSNDNNTKYGTTANYYRNDTNMNFTDPSDHKTFALNDELEYAIGFESRYSSQVFYNFTGGMYVLANWPEDAEEMIKTFVDNMYTETAIYYSSIFGRLQEDVNIYGDNVVVYTSDYQNNSVPAYMGKIEGFDSVIDLTAVFGSEETQRINSSIDYLANLAKQRKDYIYDLTPKTGYTIYEKGAIYSFDGKSITGFSISDTMNLLGLFEKYYNKMLTSNISIEETIEAYKTEAEKLGITEYLEELNTKLN